jgi:hypothetical protein
MARQVTLNTPSVTWRRQNMVNRKTSSPSAGARGSSSITTDHKLIRRWVEERGGKPASVKGTGGKEAGILRIMFPTYNSSRNQSLREISWAEFFQQFDDNNLAFIYQDKTSEGEVSNFNKFVKRKWLEISIFENSYGLLKSILIFSE